MKKVFPIVCVAVVASLLLGARGAAPSALSWFGCDGCYKFSDDDTGGGKITITAIPTANNGNCTGVDPNCVRTDCTVSGDLIIVNAHTAALWYETEGVQGRSKLDVGGTLSHNYPGGSTIECKDTENCLFRIFYASAQGGAPVARWKLCCKKCPK